MRNRVSLAAGLLVLAAAAFGAAPVRAMPISAPAVKAAAGVIDPIETVSCRIVRRCGYYGCDWRRVCWAPEPYWRPRYSYYHRPYYRPYRPYAYVRPYHRPHYYRPYVDRPYVDYGPPPPYFYRPYAIYRPYIPPPWVSGPYIVRSYYW